MAPSKWDEENSSDESSPNSPPVAAVHRRGKFDDEEDDSDVLESWDAAEDSEVEREKAKNAAEAKAKADAAAKANHKTKSQRIEEHRMAAMRRRQAEDEAESSEEEDEATRRAKMRKNEQDADLKHAEDLFGDLSTGANTKRSNNRPVMAVQDDDPNSAVDLSKLPVFNPTGKPGFDKLRDTISPLIAANSKKAQYTMFLQELAKNLAKDLPSEQIKKIASGLTTLSNEKMREEKAAEKSGKKSKAAKTKTSLVASRDVSTKADTSYYGDELGDDDFM